ncbi:MAG: pyridoxal phosphate-dependent aminotransferase [Gemmatimonadales bacterium]|nr:pyridoxal phosphate-dependent aminotransferase [Gemmatimonadales bacterium]
MPDSAATDRLSRRAFGRLLALGAAGFALPPASSLEATFARSAAAGLRLPRTAAASPVFLDSNEHPLGPAAAAQEAMARLGARGGRYPFGETGELTELFAAHEGVRPEQVMLFAGSSDPLHRAILAWTSPARPFVGGDPSYEAGQWAGRVSGARVVAVPLTPAFAHDVRAMAAADKAPGVLYVCNPNNPTGTTTPLADLEWLAAHAPGDALVIIDEAYLHFTDEPSAVHLVRQGANVLVLRTWSKLYGMAGIRLGAAIGPKPVLDRLASFGMGSLSATAIAAGRASLLDPALVPARRAETRAIREWTFAELDRMGVPVRRSVSNCFMFDARRPAREMVQALAGHGVRIGRGWPAWPTWARVTVGTREEMQAFVSALGAATA